MPIPKRMQNKFLRLPERQPCGLQMFADVACENTECFESGGAIVYEYSLEFLSYYEKNPIKKGSSFKEVIILNKFLVKHP